MPTPRQKKLAREVVENVSREKPLNAKDMLEKVGYSTNTAEAKSKDILESEGVQEELEVLGFTEDEAKKVVVEILKFGDEDNSRLKAADMIFKVRGSYAPEKKKIEGSLDIKDSSKLDAIVAEVEAQLDEPEGTTLSP